MKSFQFYLPPLPPNASIFARMGRWIRQLVFQAALSLLAMLVMFALWVWLGPKFHPTDRSESRPIDNARKPPIGGTSSSESPPTNTSDKSHKESLSEKLYEKATGKEIVHKKDGTTYERKQPKR